MKEVTEKLESLGASVEEIKEVVDWSIRENFVNEQRFTKEYIYSKLVHKHWGKFKIRYHLRSLEISESLIERELHDIPEKDYMAIFQKELLKKKNQLGEVSKPEHYKKLSNYLLQKGFEVDLVNEFISGSDRTERH